MKRVTWFVGGVVTGVTAAGYGARKIRRTASQLAPVNVARSAVDRVKDTSQRIVVAARDGRDAMRWREDELRARRDGRIAKLDDHLAPGDRVLIDGEPVEPGRVIVMRPER
jgi:hypothetical protein